MRAASVTLEFTSDVLPDPDDKRTHAEVAVELKTG